MKTKWILLVTGVLLVLQTRSANASSEDSTIFSIPAVLKDNVAFWTKIYTEVRLTEGLMHDRDYPLIIYEKVFVGDKSGRKLANYIDDRKRIIFAILNELRTQPDSVWSMEARRIAGLYDIHATRTALDSAEERIRFQLGQMDRFKQGLERSTIYLDTIRAILAENNVPERLAYLPHVESSFDYEAYSRVGAAGLWQFMRGTGRDYLKIDYLVDERRDPILATKAAAQLLRHNYETLQSWPLAITAYNHGLNGMARAVRETGSHDIEIILKRHTSPSFKFASKNFYGCFLAASEIARNPSAYFRALSFKERLHREDMTLPHYVRPDVLCTYLGVSPEIFRQYNPALRPVVYGQHKQIPAGYTVHIPATVELAKAEKKIQVIPESLATDLPEAPNYYRVKAGDNLSWIAAGFNIAAEDIARENNISRKHRIYQGQVLRIPVKTVAVVVPVAKKAAPEPSASQPSVPPVAPPAFKKPSLGLQVKISIEEKIDKKTASSIIAPFGALSMNALALHENRPDSLKELFSAPAAPLPQQSAAGRPVISAEFDAELYGLDVVRAPSGTTAEIRVSIDETLGHYADWLGGAMTRIRQLNRLNRNATIAVGHSLTIPVTGDSLDQFVQTRLEYHMAIEEDFYSQYKVVDAKSHIIKKGENLWALCNVEEIPIWLVKKYNKSLDFSYILPGTQIWLPVIGNRNDPSAVPEVRTPPPTAPAQDLLRPATKMVTPVP